MECTTPMAPNQVLASLSIFSQSSNIALAQTTFFFVEPPLITNVFPRFGSEVGGTLVTIQGRNMDVYQDENVICMFGSITSHDVTIQRNSNGSIAAIVCKTPMMIPSTVDISISANSKDYVKVSNFTYLSVPSVTNVSPILITEETHFITFQGTLFYFIYFICTYLFNPINHLILGSNLENAKSPCCGFGNSSTSIAWNSLAKQYSCDIPHWWITAKFSFKFNLFISINCVDFIDAGELYVQINYFIS